MMPYEKIKPGEWLRPKIKGYRMACCDCGLVHRLDFRVHTGRAELRANRDNRATKRLRARAELNTAVVAGPKRPNESGPQGSSIDPLRTITPADRQAARFSRPTHPSPGRARK